MKFLELQIYKQIIICVEANQKSKSDYYYIKKAIDTYYNIDNKIKLTPIYLGGKGNYNKPKIINKIVKAKREFSEDKSNDEENIVIYFFDTDNNSLDPSSVSMNEEIIKFCKEQSFELVWFNKNIEHVMTDNETVKDKVKAAQVFLKNGKLPKSSKLKVLNSLSNKGSNIKLILDKFLLQK